MKAPLFVLISTFALTSIIASADSYENLPWGHYQGTQQMVTTGTSINGPVTIGIFPHFIVFTFCGGEGKDRSCSLREYEYRLDKHKFTCLYPGGLRERKPAGEGTWKAGILEFECKRSNSRGDILKDHVKITKHGNQLIFSHISTLGNNYSDTETGTVSLVAP